MITFKSNRLAMTDYRELLFNEFSQRKLRSKSYSLRAFARDLGINKTSLSEVLAGKRTLAKKNQVQINQALNLGPNEIKSLVKSNEKTSDELKMADQDFQIISEWYFFAILNLVKLPKSKINKKSIARRLGITEIEAGYALETLTKKGLIKKMGSTYHRSSKSIQTSKDISSPALKKYHKQNLTRIEQAIDKIPLDQREISSITCIVDRDQILKAKTEIKKVQLKMAKLLSGKNPDRVYTFQVALFPQSDWPK